MSQLDKRLAELFRHLDHLREVRPRVASAEALQRDLSLNNDVLYSLLAICHLVGDIAAELGARRSLRFESYTDAVRALVEFPEFSEALVRPLERLPAFRKILIHERVNLDFERVRAALADIQLVPEFVEIVRGIEASVSASPFGGIPCRSK